MPADHPTPSPDTPERTHRGLFLDLEPLRYSRAFAKLWAGSTITGIGGQMTIVAVGLHIYDLTRDTFAVALVGVFALVPMIVFGLYGGMLADAVDRRKLALAAASVTWVSTAIIAALAWSGSGVVWPLYVLTTLNAVSSTVVGTSRSAILPRILPARLLPAASALGGISAGAAVTIGPMLAGVLVATVGIPWTYTVDLVLFIAAFWGIAALPPIVPDGATRRLPGLRSLVDGWTFLRTAPNVRSSFLIDIIAMTFGQPRVIFPALGAVLLGGGALTVGVLTAATAVGMLLGSVFSGPLGRVRYHGRAIAWAVAAYGLCIALFGVVIAVIALSGLSRVGDLFSEAHLPGLILASIALAGSGAADNVSAIFRSTMLQSAVPDAVRGRLQGLFTVVVTGGPRLGDLYSGLAATALMLWFPPLAGGLIIIILVGVLIRVQPGFLRYDAHNPVP
ncbi:MFS transporter [Mycetocola spongiae]|uniref:MFS transporter n=1 Tax=Mycetocola spongiae TaxID=2859226 RepID=UPI001CF44501|nr:MFS transporter [Mycetocola spongiae]UCR90058.1 MFS transporter [Mycetocola spongiae]